LSHKPADCANGPEFRGRALAAWSEERGVRLEFIQPGKPVQNAYIESFNGRLRDECLNANWFTSLSDASISFSGLRRRQTWVILADFDPACFLAWNVTDCAPLANS